MERQRLADERAAAIAAERANRTRLNAEQAAAAKRQREEIAAKLAASRAAQEKYARDMAENQRRTAAYKAAQDKFSRDMDEYRRKVAERNAIIAAQREDNTRDREELARQREAEAKAAEAKEVVSWLEAVTLCELKAGDPMAARGGWYCVGPLQNTHARLDTPQATVPLQQACGTSSVSDLGKTGRFRAFGCGYGLNPNPSASQYDDIPRKLGVGFVPGRGVFRCARNHSGTCRTR